MTTRAEFIKAIKDFKKLHVGKLKDLLNKETHPEVVDEFWANPIIRKYLARPNVAFTGKHPKLQDSTSKNDHDNSDHYELKVYNYLRHEISYRDEEITTDKFYSRGLFRTYNAEKDHAPRVFEALLKDSTKESKDVEIRKPEGIYQAAENSMRAEFFKCELPCSRFVLYPVWENTHASVLVDIINPSTGSVLARLFMNSGLSQRDFERIRAQFHARKPIFDEDNITESQKKKMKNFLSKAYSLNFDDGSLPTEPTLLIDKTTKSVVTINYGQKHYDFNTFLEIDESKDFERIYRVNDKIVNTPFVVEVMSRAPFIDISHNLQNLKEDKSCALFGVNFIKAMAEMLKEPDVADKVYALAYLASDNNPHAVITLQHIFREDLKSNLTCYYDANTKLPKSQENISSYHAKQQWEIGSKSVSIIHPVASPQDENSSSDEEDEDLSSAQRCVMM